MYSINHEQGYRELAKDAHDGLSWAAAAAATTAAAAAAVGVVQLRPCAAVHDAWQQPRTHAGAGVPWCTRDGGREAGRQAGVGVFVVVVVVDDDDDDDDAVPMWWHEY